MYPIGMPESFTEVIDMFGGPAAFARAVDMPITAAKQANLRNSINARWFSATAKAAKAAGLPVDERLLSRLAAR